MTLTLPVDVLETLETIDVDPGRAIVRAVQSLTAKSSRTSGRLTTLGDRSAVILLPQSRRLQEFTGVELVPLSDGQAILSFDDRVSIADFELGLRDAITDPALLSNDLAMFQELAALLRRARRSDGFALRNRNIIVLQWTNTLNGHDYENASKAASA